VEEGGIPEAEKGGDHRMSVYHSYATYIKMKKRAVEASDRRMRCQMRFIILVVS
jgi:hypothetical protein